MSCSKAWNFALDPINSAVAIVFLLALTTAGCMGISGALIVPLTKEFGWSTEQISVALALRIVLFGLMAPFTAALIDKYGFKSVVLVALGLIEIGLLGALVMTKLWHLVLFWGVIVGFGTGLTAMVLGALVATRWFTARRGLAVGLLSASSASGQLLLLPLAAWLADRYGWRVALWPPIVALVVVALVVVLFLVDKPEDVGLKPYGDKGDTPAHVALRRHSAAPSRSCSNQPAARHSGYWRARSSSAVSAPMASFRPISSPSAATTACRRSRRLRRWR